MKPQSPPPKPFCVIRSESFFEYYDTLEEAFSSYAGQVAIADKYPAGDDGLTLEIWLAQHGKWLVSDNRKEYPPTAG